MSEDTFLTPEEQAQLREVFYAQAKDMLVELGEHVLALEKVTGRSERLRALERIVHTLKGDSMALELSALSKLAHRIEDYLRGLRRMDHLRKRDIDLLLACGDLLGELLDAYCSGASTPLPDIGELMKKLVPPSDEPETRDISVASNRYRMTVSFAKDCTMHSAGAFLVRQRLEKLGRILASSPDPDTEAIEKTSRWNLVVGSLVKAAELRKAARVPGVTSRVVVKREAVTDEDDRPAEQASHAGDSEAAVIAKTTSSELLRVEVTKIDRIMNLVGELVIGRSMVTQALTELSQGDGPAAAGTRLADANGFLERTLRELQGAVLKIRMVLVEHVFRRFPRLVRDLAYARGKKVRLDIQGGLTELDKSIVDALGEPLLHLVRNAIDHGLETPEERVAAGKPPAGRLTLSAYYEGNHAHIVVEDDGRGIDVAAVARRAAAEGLIEPSAAGDLSPAELLNTIYVPGFSTKEEVSEISGRGIGMDVVRESIESLKGIIELETAPGRGTRFLIRLPLTLAILRAVLVEVAESAFAVPLTSVLEIVRPEIEEARTMLGKGVLHWRDQVIPLVPLEKALGLRGADGLASKRRFVLLVGEAERRVGLVVERLLGEQELVVKPIDHALGRSPGIAGASILGNGRVVLILHTRGLLDLGAGRARRVEVLR